MTFMASSSSSKDELRNISKTQIMRFVMNWSSGWIEEYLYLRLKWWNLWRIAAEDEFKLEEDEFKLKDKALCEFDVDYQS